MKKSASFLLAAALCCIATVPALAADSQITPDSDPKSASTELTYSVAADYIVVIPETVALDSDLTIKSTKANTEPGKAVKVSISGLNADGKAELTRANDTEYKITADVKQGEKALKNSDVVATFADVTAETAATAITVSNAASPDTNPIKAGSYSGTLTFTVSYEDA